MEATVTMPKLDSATLAMIADEAERTGAPVEAVVRRLILRGLEAERQSAQPTLHHDLDDLAGTWSAEEAEEFLRAVADFDQIDAALWQ